MTPALYTWVLTSTGSRQHAVRSHPDGQTVTMCGVVLPWQQAAAPEGERCAKCVAAIEREAGR